jgi:hypothetical protein
MLGGRTECGEERPEEHPQERAGSRPADILERR